jgi:hypothetical protein
VEYQDKKTRQVTNDLIKPRRKSMIGQNKLVIEAHPEEYLEQAHRTIQVTNNRFEDFYGKIEDSFLDDVDGSQVDLKTGAYSVRY